MASAESDQGSIQTSILSSCLDHSGNGRGKEGSTILRQSPDQLGGSYLVHVHEGQQRSISSCLLGAQILDCQSYNSHLAQADQWRAKVQLSEVVNWARVHQPTDPRDRVYGLLGHPNAMIKGQLTEQPDYKISNARAYVNFVVAVVEKTRRLRILSAVEHDNASSTEKLPT